MLYSELRKKEVVNMRDCRKLGRVVDIDLDECNGCVRRTVAAFRLRSWRFSITPSPVDSKNSCM